MEKKSKNLYFGRHIDEYLMEYNSMQESKQKELYFEQKIYPALNELVQNLIFDSIKKEKPYYTDTTYDDMKHECIIHLYSKINSFDQSRGKAFSFFNHVAIKWLIGRSKAVYAELKSKCEVEEIDSNRDLDREIEDENSSDDLTIFIRSWAKHCNSRINTLFKSKKDRKIANAIFTLFENAKYIDIYRKKALYILIREQTKCSTSHITPVLNEVRTLFTNMYKAHLNRG